MAESERPAQSHARSAPARLGAVTFAELMQGLSWPLLLRALGLAVQPARVALGFVSVIALCGVAWVYDGALRLVGSRPLAAEFLAEVWWGPQASAQALLRMDIERAVVDLLQNTCGAAARLFGERPIAAIVLMALLVPVWAVSGGAICRLVAVDVAGHLNLKARQGLRFALPRALSLLGAVLVPAVVALVLVLLLKVAGWVLLSLTWVNLIGSLLYGINLGVGLGLALVLIGYVVGHPLLVPSVAVDGADSMDAVQRAYAYVVGRPGRTLAYVALAAAQGLIILAVARWVVGSGIGAAESLSSSWISGEKARKLFDPSEPARPAAGAMIDLWRSAAWGLLAGFAVSLYFTLSTLVYLLLRRVCDEQDIHEVWMPGLIEGSPSADTDALRGAVSDEIDLADTRSGRGD